MLYSCKNYNFGIPPRTLSPIVLLLFSRSLSLLVSFACVVNESILGILLIFLVLSFEKRLYSWTFMWISRVLLWLFSYFLKSPYLRHFFLLTSHLISRTPQVRGNWVRLYIAFDWRRHPVKLLGRYLATPWSPCLHLTRLVLCIVSSLSYHFLIEQI